MGVTRAGRLSVEGNIPRRGEEKFEDGLFFLHFQDVLFSPVRAVWYLRKTSPKCGRQKKEISNFHQRFVQRITEKKLSTIM